MSQTYSVEARWDDEAKVFVSRTDIPGLVVEASTMAEFIEAAEALAPELLRADAPGRAEAAEPPRVRVRWRGELRVSAA